MIVNGSFPDPFCPVQFLSIRTGPHVYFSSCCRVLPPLIPTCIVIRASVTLDKGVGKINIMPSPFVFEYTSYVSVALFPLSTLVIDFANSIVQGISTAGNPLTRFNLPMKEFGISKIIDYAFDYNSKTFILLGMSSEPDSKSVMITYNMSNFLTNLNRIAIHYVQLPASYTVVAGFFNPINEEIAGVGFTDNAKTGCFISLDTGSPRMSLLVSNKSALIGPISLSYNARIPGKTSNTITSAQLINIIEFDSSLKINVQKDAPKFEVDGHWKNVGDVLEFQGVYNTIVNNKSLFDGVRYTMPRREVPTGVNVLFEDVILYKDIIFGCSSTTLYLSRGGNLFKISNNTHKSITSIHFIHSGKVITFLAHVKPVGDKGQVINDQIIIYYSTNKGVDWKVTFIQLDGDQYREVSFVKGVNGSIIFCGYLQSNSTVLIQQFSINTAQQAEIKLPVFKGLFKYLNTIKLTPLLKDNTNIVALIIPSNSKTATFVNFEVIPAGGIKSISLEDSSLSSDNFINGGISIDCNKHPMSNIKAVCILGGKYAYSYVYEYSFNLDPNLPSTESLVKSRLVARLMNLPNLRPVSIDFTNEIILLTLKNFQPVKASDSANYTFLTFSDKKAGLVYRIPPNLYDEDPTQDSKPAQVLFPFKIFTSLDFFEIENIDKLNMRLFKSRDDKTMISASGVASSSKSVEPCYMFALTNFSLLLRTDLTFEDPVIEFATIDPKVIASIPLRKLYRYVPTKGRAPDPIEPVDPKPKPRNDTWQDIIPTPDTKNSSDTSGMNPANKEKAIYSFPQNTDYIIYLASVMSAAMLLCLLLALWRRKPSLKRNKRRGRSLVNRSEASGDLENPDSRDSAANEIYKTLASPSRRKRTTKRYGSGMDQDDSMADPLNDTDNNIDKNL